METMSSHHSPYCLLVSTVLLAATAVSTAAVRSVIRHRLSPGLLSLCLLDFLCGVELCVCGLELGTVLDIYDVPVYALFLWIVIVWQSLSWGDSTANPNGHLLRWRVGGESGLMSAGRLLSGTAGALASYSIISLVWDLEWSHFHTGRTAKSAAGVCGSDLQVSIMAGALIEMFGTLTCSLIGNLLQDTPQLKSKPLLTTCLDAAANVAMVIAAFDLTGGYYNPALAMGLKLGCGGGDPIHLGHLSVYWVGPMVGASLAGPVYKAAWQMVGTGDKTDKKTQ